MIQPSFQVALTVKLDLLDEVDEEEFELGRIVELEGVQNIYREFGFRTRCVYSLTLIV